MERKDKGLSFTTDDLKRLNDWLENMLDASPRPSEIADYILQAKIKKLLVVQELEESIDVHDVGTFGLNPDFYEFTPERAANGFSDADLRSMIVGLNNPRDNALREILAYRSGKLKP